MATLEEDLTEGLRLGVRGQEITATRTFFAKDLTGGSALGNLAQALNMPGLPSLSQGVAVRLPGTNEFRAIFPNTYDAEPFGDADATIRVGYAERDLSIAAGSSFGKAVMSGGTSVKQIETEFSYAESQKPFLQRTPISIDYDPTKNGAVGALPVATQSQGARVPAFVPDSVVTFTRYERDEPSGRSRQYGAKRNSAPFMAAEKYSLLMMAVTFDQIGSSLFLVQYSMAYDPITLWNQVALFVNPETGLHPKLTQSQLAGENGIKEIVVQGDENFNALGIVLA